jgi:hypothetical protein
VATNTRGHRTSDEEGQAVTITAEMFEANIKYLKALQNERTELKRRLAEIETSAENPGYVPHRLRGDGPCTDCGTLNNIVWFTDSWFWNDVVRTPEPPDPDPILCLPCFVTRVDKAGFKPAGWRVLPECRWWPQP